MIDFPFFTMLQKDAPLPDNLLDTAHNFLGLITESAAGKGASRKNGTRVQVAASDKN